jgi:hypothetical protein
VSTGRRHALVIASQCKKEFTLTYLHEAARDLDAALRDGDIGACEPGLKNGESLLLGPISAADITVRIGDAIDYAAASDAVLVLALLGHGFIPGESPALYLMGWDSVNQDTRTAVNVRELLAQAANKSGVKSVIGIIDTCTAAAAVPSMADLMTGTRGGLTRLQLLMAAAVNQTAYDMRMSRALTALLTAGLPGADTHFTLEDAKHRMADALTGQNLVRFDYDGVKSGDGWLARNRQAAGQLLALGAYGTAELTAALRALPRATRCLPTSQRSATCVTGSGSSP